MGVKFAKDMHMRSQKGFGRISASASVIRSLFQEGRGRATTLISSTRHTLDKLGDQEFGSIGTRNMISVHLALCIPFNRQLQKVAGKRLSDK